MTIDQLVKNIRFQSIEHRDFVQQMIQQEYNDLLVDKLEQFKKKYYPRELAFQELIEDIETQILLKSFDNEEESKLESIISPMSRIRKYGNAYLNKGKIIACFIDIETKIFMIFGEDWFIKEFFAMKTDIDRRRLINKYPSKAPITENDIKHLFIYPLWIKSLNSEHWQIIPR